jgi:hypothetical protein
MSGRATTWRGGWRACIPGLVALGVATFGLRPGTAAAATDPVTEPGVAAPAPTPAPASATAPRPAPRPQARRSTLDTRVATLTKALDLDPKQQAELRRTLLAQRDQLLRIWSDGPVSAAERVGATRALSERTADRIRALLTEEQRKRYNAPRSQSQGDPAGQAHVEDWMPGGKRH